MPMRPERTHAKSLPSTKATFWGSFFLGIFWLIPALNASRRADQQGANGKRHIRAWAAGWATGTATGIIMMLLAWALLASALSGITTPSSCEDCIDSDSTAVIIPAPPTFGKSYLDDNSGYEEPGNSYRSGGRKRR
ncbi:MAG: hypothetical protein ACT4O0_03190 [Pseudonocardia sp.]